MKSQTKSLAEQLDDKIKAASQHDTFAREVLVCPHCGYEHDAVDMIGKKSEGTVKCMDCGEAFSFEATVRTYYSTYIE
jgi:transcription elongation factor Elf1